MYKGTHKDFACLLNILDAVAIVKTIIALAETLHLDVIAEGVEDIVQKEFLVEQGCHIVQGYYYSKPLPANEMKEILLAQKG